MFGNRYMEVPKFQPNIEPLLSIKSLYKAGINRLSELKYADNSFSDNEEKNTVDRIKFIKKLSKNNVKERILLLFVIISNDKLI